MSDKKEAVEELAKHVAAFEASLAAAVKVADEHGLMFDIYPAYGMGGRYVGKGTTKYNYRNDDGDTVREEGEWISSSQGC
jgi:hypothetical protein